MIFLVVLLSSGKTDNALVLKQPQNFVYHSDWSHKTLTSERLVWIEYCIVYSRLIGGACQKVFFWLKQLFMSGWLLAKDHSTLKLVLVHS